VAVIGSVGHKSEMSALDRVFSVYVEKWPHSAASFSNLLNKLNVNVFYICQMPTTGDL
jgi:hypothetical protein